MKKICLFFVLLLLFLPSTAFAVRDGALIMSPKSTSAYFYDGTNVTGISLVSKKGVIGCPYISSFGKVYVSLDHMLSVLVSDADTERYIYNERTKEITIKLNSKKAVIPVGKKFMVRNDKDSEGMFVYEIDGSFYVPARFLALMCDGSVVYNDQTDDIVFFTNNELKSNVTEEDGSIKESFSDILYEQSAMNNLCENNKYLLGDTDTVLYEDNASSVFRVGTDVYFIKDYKLYLKKNGNKEENLNLIDAEGRKNAVYVCSAVAAGGKIYGISAPQPAGSSGRVFTCEYDGTGFKYINSLSATCLIKQVVGRDEYIYYIASGRDSSIYMFNVATEDEYKLIIQDKNGNSPVGYSDRFGIMTNGIFTVATDKKSFGLILFDRAPYECEWIKIRDDKNIKRVSTYDDGRSFSEIVCVNYDSDSGLIYAIDKSDKLYTLICIEPTSSDVVVLKEFSKEIKNICLFEINGEKKLYVEGKTKTEDIITLS